MLDKSDKELRGTFGKFATGVAVITFVSSKGLKLGITINSYTSLSLNPPMILWCLDKVSDLYQEIINLDNYVINFLSDSQKEVAHLLSQKNDHSLESIDCIQNEKGIKIKNCIGWISCSKDKSIDSGDHSILIANVIDYSINKGNPLIFWESSYRSISE